MKHTLYLYLLLLLVPLGSCINDDPFCLSDDGNVILKLSYTDTSGDGILGKTITTMDMVLFRDDYRYYNRLSITPDDISEDGSIRFDLPEGTYYLVFWGNLGNRTKLRDFNSFTTINDAGVYHAGSDTGDPLYYAPYRTTAGLENYEMYALEVPSRGVVEEEFRFMNAHRTINVFVDGLTTTKASGMPTISLDNLHNGYNFHLVAQSTTASFTQPSKSTETPDGVLPGASFLVSHFDLNNPISIRLEGTPNDAAMSGILFSEFLREYGYTPVLGDGAVINVIVTVSDDGSLTIRLPQWGEEDTKPSY